MSRRTLPLLLATTIALAGCGAAPRGTPSSPRRPPSQVLRARRHPRRKEHSNPANSAASVLARYAEEWVNWSAATLPHERAALLALASGQLAEQLRQDAAQAVRAQLQEVGRVLRPAGATSA